MKLITFHFAGGNQYSFSKIFKGHTNNHIPFALQRDTDDLDLNEAIHNFLLDINEKIFKNSPYVIYGHSMGALIGYLICQKLQEDDLPMPQKLIISGKKAASIPREKKLAHLSDNEFWNEILTLGGIPDEMQNYPELIEYYLPILRHDFKLVENYQYEKKSKLNIPIDVFYGSEESTEEEMLGWQNETTEKVTITKLEGNHFFIFNHVEYFRNYFDNLIHQK
ncbi:thioesterase II family protein [Chryseobacterium potabilaquae]|uniref:Surfactin synthase thioesterase subunit n=1 Tax=Chryseobacterium potabilaquae TaxID=2675057 RepID=A0A6N4X6M7_9FLAO|nr:thioesterase [Chryseobacterium potabilaquae]CAA7196351.1 Surfactin synthase thioesterase subunit [Chryseobacterium potabilaquae]